MPKKGVFPIKWAYTIGVKYNLSTDWIITGNGPKKKNERPKKKFLLLVDQWLNIISKNDPGRDEWFKYHFMDSFPSLKGWFEEQEAAEKGGELVSSRGSEKVT